MGVELEDKIWKEFKQMVEEKSGEEKMEEEKWAKAKADRFEKEVEEETKRLNNGQLEYQMIEKIRKRVYMTAQEREEEEKEERLAQIKEKEGTLRPSLFANVPPFLRFVPTNSLPGDGMSGRALSEAHGRMGWYNWERDQDRNVVDWAVQDCIEYNGFKLSQIDKRPFTDKLHSGHVWDGGLSLQFKYLDEKVKANHFPGIREMGSKNKLFRNFSRMREKHGPQGWSFMEDTFILPAEEKLLKEEMEKTPDNFWIVKPPDMSCGQGIRIINDLRNVPETKMPLCVQRYIMEPLLIDGLKFDLRVYVLVTSIAPLRIYLYDEGLTRFATERYSTSDDDIDNMFIHLTNYSINKGSELFEQNIDPENPQGSKWTLTSLWKYLYETSGIERQPIWDQVEDIVIRSILSTKESLQAQWEEVNSHYNCYMLLGYDILLDNKLQAHLIEINSLPSLHANPNSIDAYVKHPLVAEAFNIAGFHLPPGSASRHEEDVKIMLGSQDSHHLPRCMGHDSRLYSKQMTEEDLAREDIYDPTPTPSCKLGLMNNMSPRDVRLLVHAEEELSQTKLFKRIWPTRSSHNKYLHLFDSVPYSEKLMGRPPFCSSPKCCHSETFEKFYAGNREAGRAVLNSYCMQNHHLQVPKPEQLLLPKPNLSLNLPPLKMPPQPKPSAPVH